MAITTNFNQTPEELILELFNADNGTAFTSQELDILDGHKDLLGGRRSVTAKILDLSLVDADIPYATLTFQPIVIPEQFSQIELEIREIDCFDENHVVQYDKIMAEITRRYKILVDDVNFGIRQDGGVYYFYATEANRAYTGEVPIALTLSFWTRVPNRELRGFYAKEPLEWAIEDQSVSAFEMPEDGLDVQRVTWHQNFTEIRNLLEVKDGRLVYPDQLNAYLEQYGIPPIPADAPVVNRIVRNPDENSKYSHILKTTGLSNKETHYLHYYGA